MELIVFYKSNFYSDMMFRNWLKMKLVLSSMNEMKDPNLTAKSRRQQEVCLQVQFYYFWDRFL